MKRIYIKSVIELDNNNLIKKSESDFIGDLFLFDLDNNCYYYVFNTVFTLEKSKRTLFYAEKIDSYIQSALDNSYEISEESFNQLLKISGKDIYNTIKNDLLKNINLYEYII